MEYWKIEFDVPAAPEKSGTVMARCTVRSFLRAFALLWHIYRHAALRSPLHGKQGANVLG